MFIKLQLLFLLAAGIAGVFAWRAHRRQRAFNDVLDAADALEARLREARSEIEAIAGSDENPVRGAMQDILRQRLWLQENANTATVSQLRAVRQSLDKAREQLELQLRQLDQARAGG